MVAIRRPPAPPPESTSQDSDSSAAASKAKALHSTSHLPKQPSPLINGKSREDSNHGLREDGSRDTVSQACEQGCIIAHCFRHIGSSSNKEEQRRAKNKEWGKGASLGMAFRSISFHELNRNGRTRMPTLSMFCCAISCYFSLFILCLYVPMTPNSSPLSVAAYPSIVD